MNFGLWLAVFGSLTPTIARAEPEALSVWEIPSALDPACATASDRLSGCFVIPGALSWRSEAPNFRITPAGEAQSVGIPRNGERVRMPPALLEAWLSSSVAPGG